MSKLTFILCAALLAIINAGVVIEPYDFAGYVGKLEKSFQKFEHDQKIDWDQIRVYGEIEQGKPQDFIDDLEDKLEKELQAAQISSQNVYKRKDVANCIDNFNKLRLTLDVFKYNISSCPFEIQINAGFHLAKTNQEENKYKQTLSDNINAAKLCKTLKCIEDINTEFNENLNSATIKMQKNFERYHGYFADDEIEKCIKEETFDLDFSALIKKKVTVLKDCIYLKTNRI